MKIATVIGARPQFIKTAQLSNSIRKQHEEILIHTGQHYDDNMSRVFFEELKIPKPDYNLEIGSCNHGEQTGKMIIELEKIYLSEKPDLVIVYGDTNSTLAGALCASKLLIPIVHIEAGLRSFNMKMPEEQNRILTDHISNLLFVPTNTAKNNLTNEGINKGVYNVGDVMFDSILYFKKLANKKQDILNKINVKPDQYILATIHRAENTNDNNKLKNIVEALNQSKKRIVLPIHPRTKKYIQRYGLKFNDNVTIINSVGYLEMMNLEMNCEKIVTDSGGVQKEAFFMKKPCITIRNETEWVETVENGWNIIVGDNKQKIIECINKFKPEQKQDNIFGDGNATAKILNIINTNIFRSCM